MRTERNWSQITAGEILGKPQNVISRLESPAYGKLSIQTLLEVAKGFDVGLLIKFVPYSRLLREYEDVSIDALKAASPNEKFPDELAALNKWANESDEDFWEVEPESELVAVSRNQAVTATKPLTAAGGNPQKSLNQRTLRLTDLTLVASDHSIGQLVTPLDARNSQVQNVKVARG